MRGNRWGPQRNSAPWILLFADRVLTVSDKNLLTVSDIRPMVASGDDMAHAKPLLAVIPEFHPVASRIALEHCTRVQPDYMTVVDGRRRFVEVSSSFCKLLGYPEQEIVGKTFDEFTVPGTNHIPILWNLFIENGYLHGIWVFAHRSGTKLFVRFEAFARTDDLYQAHMQLLGAGA
jgi:PAS domain S-box-containing protein